jgi:hypothetical protein
LGTIIELTELLQSHGLYPELTNNTLSEVQQTVLSKQQKLKAKGAMNHE